MLGPICSITYLIGSESGGSYRAIFQQIKEAHLGNTNSMNENGLYHVSILEVIIFLG
jgi:hypothetical protein